MKRTFTLWVITLLLVASAVFANPIFSTSSTVDTVTAGQSKTFDLAHTAADNGAATLALEGAPSFVTISTFDATTARVTASPGASLSAATYNFNASVQDNDNVLSKHSFTLTVTEAPVIGLNSTTLVTLGNNRQDASNPIADDVNDRIVRLPGTMKIRNDGTSTVSGIGVTVVPNGFQSSELNFSIDTAGANALPSSLNPGEEKTIGFQVNVPAALDAVDSRLIEKAFKVADITFTGTIAGKSSQTSTELQIQRENKLTVDKVRVCVNDRCKSVDDGDDVEGIRPGDDISVEIIVENKYSDSDREDVEFEDVEISFEIDDGDFDEDDSETLGDLGADEQDSETFTFSVDDDVDDGNSDMVIRVSGEDENRAFHGEEIEITLEVERDTHDVEIRSAILNPSTLTCSQDSTRVNVNFANLGKRDEDETFIEVVVDEFGITERLGPFELDEDDSRAESLTLVLPDDRDAKTYPVIVRTLYDTTVPSDEEILELVVADCEGDSSSDDSSSDDMSTTSSGSQQVTVQQQPVVQQRRQPVSSTSSSSETETSFTDSGWYIALLALVAIVILGVLIVLVVKALGRSSEEL